MRYHLAPLAMCLFSLANSLPAQILVNPVPVGSGIHTFDVAPPVSSWSTATNAGASGEVAIAAALDALVITNDASNIIWPLPTNGITPVTTSQAARWNSTLRRLATIPGGVRNTILMATLQNNTGASQGTLNIAYDLGDNQFAGSGAQTLEEIPGHRVFYSLTGASGSWQLIPELSSVAPGSLLATLTIAGGWPSGSLLYILWADDNGSSDRNNTGSEEGGYTIDNFQALTGPVPPPTITQHPRGTNIIFHSTIRLNVTATGLGLTYAWFKDGVALDSVANPSAATANLVITNAECSDTGDYLVTVQNVAGGLISATVPVQVDCRGDPPRMIQFSQVPGSSNSFRLAVDEPLCEGPPDCPFGDATFVFNWELAEVGTSSFIFIESITPENGTDYIFTLPDGSVDPRKEYYLRPVPGAVTDRFNSYPLSGSITSSLVRIFNTDIADAEIHANAGADTPLGAATSISVDLDDAGVAQGLLRFNDLFGPGDNQIPPGSTIFNATLILNQTDQGSAARFHRMLVNWDQATVTWNSLTNGVTADGVEAVITHDSISVPEPFANGPMHIDVTPSVQAWSDGSANYGWAILSTGTGGWDFSSAESDTPPILVVTYRANREPIAPQITVPPASVTVTEGNSFTLTASLSGAFSATYQWTRDNVDIPGANGSSYTAVAVPGPGGNGGNYRLRVTNPHGTAASAPALVTVNPDLTPPVITRATSSADGTTVTLRFSKQLSAAGSYTFYPEVADVTANLNNGANNATVTVTSAARTLTTPYRLTVTDARDNRVSQNVISPNPSVVDLTGVTPVLGWADAGHWNYATNDQAGNPNWKTGTLGPEWLVGQQFFGYELTAFTTDALPIQPNPIRTPLRANDTNLLGAGNSDIFVSQYFYRQVTLLPLEPNTAFALSFYVDDGAIFYLDGVEVGRYQMPAGPVAFTTRSTGGNGDAVLQTLLFFASAGIHHLAVEVHQAGVSSSDVLFGLEINIVTLPSALVIERDQGTNVVSWAADSFWNLSSSLTVNGNYAPVAGNPLRIFRVPPAAQTNRAFYRLHYNP